MAKGLEPMILGQEYQALAQAAQAAIAAGYAAGLATGPEAASLYTARAAELAALDHLATLAREMHAQLVGFYGHKG